MEGQQREAKAREASQQAISSKLEGRIRDLELELQQMREKTIKPIEATNLQKEANISFVKQLAARMEERFTKLEAVISSIHHGFEDSEQSTLRTYRQFDDKLSQFERRLETFREQIIKSFDLFSLFLSLLDLSTSFFFVLFAFDITFLLCSVLSILLPHLPLLSFRFPSLSLSLFCSL